MRLTLSRPGLPGVQAFSGFWGLGVLGWFKGLRAVWGFGFLGVGFWVQGYLSVCVTPMKSNGKDARK